MNKGTLEGVWLLQPYILNSNCKSITLFMFNFKDGIKVSVTHFFITQIRTNFIFFLIKLEKYLFKY